MQPDRSILTIFIILCLSASTYAAVQTTQTSTVADEKQLEVEIQNLLKASKAEKPNDLIELNKKMLLPDPDGWFKQVFGDEAGAKLALDYRKRSDFMKSENSLKELKMVVDSGRSEVVVKKVVETGDTNNYFDTLLSKMKSKPEIYEVRLIKHGSPVEFFEMGFFTYLDGTFRTAGDLRAVR